MNNSDIKFDDHYWTERYLENKAGWDIGHPSTPLKEFINQLKDPSISILIPGCGNAYEAEYLFQKGFTNITLLDISSALVERLKGNYKDKNINILHEDFFDHKGQYDLILEQTFYCALYPSLRKQYADKIHQLLKHGGKLTGVLFNRQFDESPPFGGTEHEYRMLFQKKFNIKKMELCYNSITPRKGTELFFILEK